MPFCQNWYTAGFCRSFQNLTNPILTPHSWNICSWPLSLIKLVFPGTLFCKVLLRRSLCGIYGWFEHLKSSSVDQSTDPLIHMFITLNHTLYLLFGLAAPYKSLQPFTVLFQDILGKSSIGYAGFSITHHNSNLVLLTGANTTPTCYFEYDV